MVVIFRKMVLEKMFNITQQKMNGGKNVLKPALPIY